MSIRKHTAFNLAGAILPLTISLITIPIYVSLIGEARYGILSIAWLLLGYFGLFDLGLGRATAQRIASLRAGTVSQRAKAFWSALLVNLGLGILGGFIIWPVAYYVFGSAVSIDENLRPEIIATVPWFSLFIPFATLSGVLNGALIGRERFLELNVISIVGAALFQLLPLVAVMIWGPTLNVIIPVVLFSRALILLALLNRCFRHVCPGQHFAFEISETTHLLKFGGWVTLTSIVGPVMVISDRMVIGVISGATAVTTYTIPFQLGERTTMLAQSVASALFPRLSGLEDNERAKLAVEAQSGLISIVTPFSVIGILLIEPFMALWISAEFSKDAALVGIIIMAGFWMNSLAMVPYSLIQAGGRPDLVAKLHLAELLPYLVMLYLGIRFLGPVGAALAFSVRVTFDALMLYWIAGQLRTFLALSIAQIFLIGAAVVLSSTNQPGSVVWSLSSCILLALASIRAWQSSPIKFETAKQFLAERIKSKQWRQ